jgi:2-phosphosulfolactate phosphatase
MINFKIFPLALAHEAEGVVIVIDVLRAFTTAAYAFNVGALKIYPVKSIEDAFSLKRRLPGSMIMGERDGIQPEGFDFGNSPASICRADLTGLTLIQRTSAGTQGIVGAINAERLFAASFVVAEATAQHIWQLDPNVVSLIITGESKGRDGDEDLACGEYIQSLITGDSPNPAEYIARVSRSTVGKSLWAGKNQVISKLDYLMTVQVDIFPFSMPIRREDDLLIMEMGSGLNLENGMP